ncbi:F0F1 ATP synthase subunit gamma, partial [Patescibacteria group bacterium]
VGILENVSSENIKTLTEKFVDLYKNKKYDSFLVAYTNFISTTNQEPVVRSVLPVSVDEVEKIIKDIVPEKGKYSDLNDNSEKKDEVLEYIFEPSKDGVLEVAQHVGLITVFAEYSDLPLSFRGLCFRAFCENGSNEKCFR